MSGLAISGVVFERVSAARFWEWSCEPCAEQRFSDCRLQGCSKTRDGPYWGEGRPSFLAC